MFTVKYLTKENKMLDVLRITSFMVIVCPRWQGHAVEETGIWVHISVLPTTCLYYKGPVT